MNVQDLLFLFGVFTLVSAMAFALLQYWLPHALHRRLALLRTAGAGGTHRARWRLARSAWLAQLTRWLESIKPEWVMPAGAGERARDGQTSAASAGVPNAQETLASRLVQAGVRAPSAPVAFQLGRVALALLLPMVVMLALWGTGRLPDERTRMLLVVSCAVLGYVLPFWALRHAVHRRQQALFRAFPDALDLMRVCVQAGLGLDAAIERVGREVRLASAVLSDELGLTVLELRAGVSRADALRHMASRVGLPEVDALATMLIQSDRLGASMADALQVHSQALRTQRRLRAEEAAAKLPVKLLFPLIFCVFPSLLTVLLGPAVIRLVAHLSQAAAR